MAGTMPHAIFMEPEVDGPGTFAAYAAEFPGCAVFSDSDEAAAAAMPGRVAAFGAWLRARSDKPLNLYKVSVACTQPELEAWLGEAAGLGCRDVFMVGGDSSQKPLALEHLSVGQATKIAHRLGFHCGGIVIPTRRREFVSRPARSRACTPTTPRPVPRWPTATALPAFSHKSTPDANP